MNDDSENKTIVIVTNTMLFPARRNGASVRYYPVVNELINRGYKVDLIILNRYFEKYSKDDLVKAQQIYRSVDIIDTKTSTLSLTENLVLKASNFIKLLSPFGIPYCLIENNKQHYLFELENILKNKKTYRYGIGVGIGGNNAVFLNELSPETKPKAIVCDFIDSVYLLQQRSPKTFLKSINPLTLLENSKTRRWEKHLSSLFNCIYISKEDANACDSHATIIPNCVVADDFEEAESCQLASPNIGFIGNMEYQPNVEACLTLCEDIFPALVKNNPDAHLYIIGRNPSDSLLDFKHHPNIHITGKVDNIWSYIKSIDIFVFPITSGAGLQNKVLEAMYAEKPVICSAIANEGIAAIDNEHLYIAETTEDYIALIEKLFAAENTIGENAKKFIDEHFSTKKNTDAFEKTLNIRHL